MDKGHIHDVVEFFELDADARGRALPNCAYFQNVD